MSKSYGYHRSIEELTLAQAKRFLPPRLPGNLLLKSRSSTEAPGCVTRCAEHG
jgi:hypothetical protein